MRDLPGVVSVLEEQVAGLLQLDPDRTCYRDAFVGAVEAVDYRGGA